MPPEGANEEMVMTYLQKLSDGYPQKFAALAGMNQQTVVDDLQEPAEMSLANAIIEGAEQPGPETVQSVDPALVEEAAGAPVAASIPEKANHMPPQLHRSPRPQ